MMYRIIGLFLSLGTTLRGMWQRVCRISEVWILATIAVTTLFAAPIGAAGFASAYGDASVAAVATDGLGQSFIAGDFSEAIVDIGGFPLLRNGDRDIFVAKLDDTGAVLWARSFWGTVAYARAISVDTNGNIYLAGEQSGSLTEPSLVGIGDQDAFLMKLDGEGNPLWARNFGGSGASAVATAVAVDASGQVYLGGYQSGSLTEPNLPAVGYFDAFAFKFDDAGNYIWFKNFGGSSASTYALGIAVDASGNVLLAGAFELGNLPGLGLTRIGDLDAFALKLNSSGEKVWADRFGGQGATSYGSSIAVDSTGIAYIAGYYCGAELTVPVLARKATGSSCDSFVMNLDLSGTVVWAKGFGGAAAYTYTAGVALDGQGYVYLAGGYSGGSITAPELNPVGLWDAFALRIDATTGSTVWASGYGGAGADVSSAAIAVDGTGRIFLGGTFKGASLVTPQVPLAGVQFAGFLLMQLTEAPPKASTGGTMGVTTTAATLFGLVSSNGATTTVIFEYGLDTNYGSLAAATQSPLDPTSIGVGVSSSLTTLTCGTLYHYRVKATNLVGSAYGSDSTFTTAACPIAAPTATTGSATGLTPSGATLSGMVSANGASTTVAFEYGLSTSYGGWVLLPDSVTGQNTPVTGAVTGLTCNTLYHYRAAAFNTKGAAYGGDKTFTTSSCSALLAPIVTNPATAVTSTTVTLNGVANANGYVTTVDFQYGLTTAYDHTVPAAQGQLPGDAKNVPVSVGLTGLTCNTLYHFRARATDINGTYDGHDLRVMTAPCGAGLTVKPLGTGIGAATSSPAGINCGAACSQLLPVGTTVTLTASNPVSESVFGWWGGACAGSQVTCTVTVSGPVMVTATFMYTGTQGAYDQVQDAYMAYYGRPADPAGRAYWASRTDALNRGLDPIIGEFGYSEEFKRRYGGMSSTDLVTGIYRQLLARDPDSDGLAFYVGKLDTGAMTLQRITLDVLYGVRGGVDAITVANKKEVANYFSDNVAAGCPYGTEQDGLDVLAIVDGDPATVVEAKALVDRWCGN